MTDLLELPHCLENRRRAIGMTKTAVAQRAGVSLPTVNRILSGKEKRLTLENIEAIAKALGVVIRLGAETAFVEVDSGPEMRRKQAERKARQIVMLVQGTMALESQAVEPCQLQEMIQQTTHELLAGSRRDLWK
jgi:transcriptional regulator with XRE-family HTH domain